MLFAEDPAVADQPRQAPRGVGAAAETKQVQLVARVERLGQKPVAVTHIARQAVSERATEQALIRSRAHARLVVQELAGLLAGQNGEGELRHVRRRSHTPAKLVGFVPRSVTANYKPPGHRSPPVRARE